MSYIFLKNIKILKLVDTEKKWQYLCLFTPMTKAIDISVTSTLTKCKLHSYGEKKTCLEWMWVSEWNNNKTNLVSKSYFSMLLK